MPLIYVPKLKGVKGCHTGQVRAVGRAIAVAFFNDNGVIGHLQDSLFSFTGR
jgi:hypothetical protein